jgi:hypothetical protein
MADLMDCLDAFVRAGWPAAQARTSGRQAIEPMQRHVV